MSISCLRIRSSSRSSGPSYTSDTLTVKGKSLSRLCFAGVFVRTCTFAMGASSRTGFASSLILSSARGFVLQRHAHGFASLPQGSFGYLPCLRRACLQNIPRQARVVLIFLAPLLHG